jgi:hypothetical protein
MTFSVPVRFHRWFYLGVDFRARHSIGDELFGIGIGRAYCGIYPTKNGFEVAYGIVDDKGCL